MNFFVHLAYILYLLKTLTVVFSYISNTSFFPDKIGIDALLNHFDVTEHIEAKLNREDSFLQNWRQLAQLYKEDGLINEEEIPSLEPKKDTRSPTAGLMLHALKRDDSSVKVEDLIVYLAKMRRTDCLNVVARYLKGMSFLIYLTDKYHMLFAALKVRGFLFCASPLPKSGAGDQFTRFP